MPLLSIDTVIRTNARAYPHRTAASMEDEALTYAELDAASNRLAHVLRARGIGHGDRVVSWSDNDLRLIPFYIALAKLGAVFAPINARLSLEEAEAVIALADPVALLADAGHGALAEAVARRRGLPCLSIARTGDDLYAEAEGAPGTDIAEGRRDENDVQVLFFTSGSTGQPKGVMLSHRANYLRSVQGGFIDTPLRKVCMFPLFHMASFQLAHIAWQTVGEITFVRSPVPTALLDAVQARHANHLYCIPAVWARILAEDTARWDLSSLRIADTGTSATPPELIASLKQRFPQALVRVFYGSTEAGLVAGLFDRDVLRKPGSVGTPIPGIELDIGAEGEILVRSPMLMSGYFRNPDANRNAFSNGWFRSGDKGAFDEEGYLHITGRLKDVIRTGGESVAPIEVEQVLARHPAVAEAAVFGIPDAQWGEIVCAALVPKDGTSIDTEALRAYCKDRLAPHKLPRRIALIDRIPRTAATGQIQRTLLAEWLQSRA